MKPNKENIITEKQKQFCNEYLIDLNGAQACIRAGYSKNTAKEQATRLLTNVNVIKYLNELRIPLAKSVQITQEMVLKEYAKIAFGNVQDYLNSDLTPKDLMAIEPEKAQAIGSIKRTTFTTSEGAETETVEFKMHDKLKALDSIGKHLGFFENDNKQKKDDTTTAPIINVFNTPVPMAGSEDQVKD